jgi:hypothetical protein
MGHFRSFKWVLYPLKPVTVFSNPVYSKKKVHFIKLCVIIGTSSGIYLQTSSDVSDCEVQLKSHSPFRFTLGRPLDGMSCSDFHTDRGSAVLTVGTLWIIWCYNPEDHTLQLTMRTSNPSWHCFLTLWNIFMANLLCVWRLIIQYRPIIYKVGDIYTWSWGSIKSSYNGMAYPWVANDRDSLQAQT